ncbi:MAG: hypothetical protein HRU25_09455 [Psychrobium sp.]|nr:hypothetical protein [Psychrobium sp.]
MTSNSKRLVALLPVLMLTSVASTSYIDQQTLFESCQAQYSATQASTQCQLVVHGKGWFDWITGSSSTQFHFIDLLELITPIQSNED